MSSNDTGLEAEIIEMLGRLKYASITMTPIRGSTGYEWECADLKMYGSGFTFVEVLERALNDTMAALWALDADMDNPDELPESIRAILPPGNLEILRLRYLRKQQERREVQGA
jgi:hypothetical protein